MNGAAVFLLASVRPAGERERGRHRCGRRFVRFQAAHLGEQISPSIHRVRIRRDRLFDHAALVDGVLLGLKNLRQVERRKGAFRQQVHGALECSLGLLPLFLLQLSDAKPEPILTAAAEGHDFAHDLFGALEAPVLHQLLNEQATPVEVVLIFTPVLFEARQQVVQANGDRPALGVLDLHRGAVEAEQLPHLIDLEGDRPFGQRGRQFLRRLTERQNNQCITRHTSRKRAHGRNDGRAALQVEVGGDVRGPRGGRLSHRGAWSSSAPRARQYRVRGADPRWGGSGRRGNPARMLA